jgi:hypothetical protein
MGSDVNWSFVPEAPIDAASVFDPNLASPTPSKLAAPPLPARPKAQAAPAVAPAPEEEPNLEEENLWLAAVAKAKAQPAVEVASEPEESEEDWEALMAAARQRADAEASPVAKVLAVARERAKSEPPVAPASRPVFAALPPQPERPLDSASAQVERGAVAANDDRLPVVLSSLPVKAVSTDEDTEWQRLRAEVEAKEQAENERKLRAIREIRRLRGNRGNTGNVPMTKPATRRFAAGTVQPPVDAASSKKQAVVLAPRPVQARASKSIGATTTRSLPRITQRLNKGS